MVIRVVFTSHSNRDIQKPLCLSFTIYTRRQHFCKLAKLSKIFATTFTQREKKQLRLHARVRTLVSL